MNAKTFAKTLLTAATLAAAFAGGQAVAGTVSADNYGYASRTGERNAFFDGAHTGERNGFVDGAHTGERNPFTDGARVGKADPFTDGALVALHGGAPSDKGAPFHSDDRNAFTDGARSGLADPYTDGARTVAGLDRTGVSGTPARSADPYTEGARIGKFDVFTEGANA